MPLELSALEARVVGCLLEKQIATPDQYPLSLNALVNACNQKSNRDPVMNLQEREVQPVVDALIRKQVVLEKSGFGSRVPKYHQLFCNTQFGSLKFSPAQTAIVCELLLRGPQTPGELRTHAGRLATVNGLDEVENALEDLATRPEGPFVVKLPREPGRRESRYAQLFTGPIDIAALEAAQAASAPMAAASTPSLAARVESLEADVADLRVLLARLQARIEQRLGHLARDFARRRRSRLSFAAWTSRQGKALQLDADHAAFIQGAVSVVVSSRNSQHVPDVVRGCGCRVSRDRRRVTVLVEAARSGSVLEDIARQRPDRRGVQPAQHAPDHPAEGVRRTRSPV